MPKFVGYVSIRVNPEAKAVYLERSPALDKNAKEGDAKRYAGSTPTKWSHLNAEAIVQAMETAAKVHGCKVGKPSAKDAGNPDAVRWNGIAEPEGGREGKVAVLLRPAKGHGVFIAYLDPQAATEGKGPRESKILTL